jgi:hypothetical protein
MPGNHFRAAKEAGCDRATAKRGWEKGWPYEWAPPIQNVLKDEHVYLRAARQLAAEEADQLVAVKLAEIESDAVRKLEEANIAFEASMVAKADADTYVARRMEEAESKAKARYNELLDKAKVDALETMGDEANMTKMGRKAAMGSVFIAASFFQNAKLIAEKFQKAFEQAEWTPAQALKAGQMLTALTKQANEAVRESLENERRRVGKPTEIFGIASVDATEEQVVQEMEIELDAVHEALARMKDRKAEADTTLEKSNGTTVPVGPLNIN